MSQKFLRWLHISDIHAEGPQKDRNTADILERTVKHVEEKVAAGFLPDLLFITGDVSKSGERDQYHSFHELLLDRLKAVIGTPGIDRATFIVPGNRDVIRAKRAGFNRAAMLVRTNPFFRPDLAGRQERDMILPRFQGFLSMIEGAPGWLDSEAGCHVEILNVDRSSVGIVLTNTAWLSRGDDDSGRLTPGVTLVEPALKKIAGADLRFVVGHHPLEMLEPDDAAILRQLFRYYRVIYLHGSSEYSEPSGSQIDSSSSLTVRGLTLNGGDNIGSAVQGVIWGQAEPGTDRFLLQPQRYIRAEQWEPGAPGFPPEAVESTSLPHGPWWKAMFPAESSTLHFDRPLVVPVYATRYTRRTRNDRVVYEHAERASGKDVGEAGLKRGPMLVDEALSFFSAVLLLGSTGAGKTFALNRLYDVLSRAYRNNDPQIIREKYPDWRHAPLPMPLRIDAPSFLEWLSADRESRPSAGDGSHPPEDQPLLRYAITIQLANAEVCPEPDLATLTAHCHRESFVLLVDDWGALEPEEANGVKAEIRKLGAIGPRYPPATIYSAALDSAGYVRPSDSDFERIIIASLTAADQQRFIDTFCLLHGRQSQGFQEIAFGLRSLALTPGGLLALLREWQSAGFPTKLNHVASLNDLYRIRISHAFGRRLNGIEEIRPLAHGLLQHYLQAPSQRLLTFRAAQSLDASELEERGLLRRHRDGQYSIRDIGLQDYLLGWALVDSAGPDLKNSLESLLASASIRREPVKFALLRACEPAYSIDVNEILEVLLSRHGDTVAAATAADFLVQAELRPIPHSILELARARFSESFLDASASSLDRYVIGRALALCRDTRAGVGNDITDSLPDIQWIPIHQGTARLGQTGKDRRLYNHVGVPPNDEPGVEFDAPRFWMTRYPITNAQFDLFMRDRVYGHYSSYPWNGARPAARIVSAQAMPNDPVASVSWDEAKAYCRWYSRIAGRQADLPDSRQWEYAARGENNDRVFPYGDESRPGRVNSQEEGLPGVTAVGAFPDSDSPFQVADMSGNVFEWCDDAHQPGIAAVEDYKVTKGGSYNHDLPRCRAATRGKKHRSSQHPYLGFRMCSAAEAVLRPRVVIVGGGFSGTCTAIRLLAQADRNLEIVMVENSDRRAFGGLAYCSETAHWEHLFNLQAGRISLYREDRDDLVRFLDHEADRSDWKHFRDTRFERPTEVPRRLYSQYLEDRLRKAAAGAHPDVSLRLVEGEVVRVSEDPRGVIVRRPGQEDFHIACEQLLLCTGNLQIKRPDFLKEILKSERYFEDQYCLAARRALQALQPGKRVLVIGSALRGLDVVMTLRSELSDLRNENVKVVLLSRYGRMHFKYASNHEHRVLDIPQPDFLKGDGPLSAEQFVQQAETAFHAALRSPILKDVPEDLRSERILKAWEQYVPRTLKRLKDGDIRLLLSKYKSLITVKRIGVVPRIGKTIEEAIRSGSCSVIKAEIESIRELRGSFYVKFKEAGKRERVEFFDIIVNCMGREQDYRKLDSPLWRHLLQTGAASPHEKTGIGVSVDEHGLLIGANGESSKWMGAVGVMREGLEFERFGRLGSFSFTLGPLKNQAFEAAVYVLRRMDRRTGPPLGLRKNIPHLDGSGVNELVLKCAETAWWMAFADWPAEEPKIPMSSDVVWQLTLDRLKARTYQQRSALLPRIREFETAVVAAQVSLGIQARDRQLEFVRCFHDCLKEVGLAHLTRIDEVEPGERRRLTMPIDAHPVLEEPAARQAAAATVSRSGIEAQPVLRRAGGKKHVFISYCRENATDVDQLQSELASAGEIVWWDREIGGGQEWPYEILRAIRDAYAFVLCLSQEYVARHTSGVNKELSCAIEEYLEYAPGATYLIPVRLSECETPPIEIDSRRRLDRLEHVDLFPGPGRAAGLQKLLQALRKTPYHPSNSSS